MYQEVKSSYFTVTSDNIHDLEKQIKEKIEKIKEYYHVKKINYKVKNIEVKKDENGKVISYTEGVLVCYFIDKHITGLGHGKVNNNGESQGDDSELGR